MTGLKNQFNLIINKCVSEYSVTDNDIKLMTMGKINWQDKVQTQSMCP